MSIKNLSNSRLNTALECEYQYYLRYHKRERPKRESSWFHTGKVVHAAIEAYYDKPLTIAPERRLDFLKDSVRAYWATIVGEEAASKAASCQGHYEQAIEASRPFVSPKTTHVHLTKYFKENWAPVLEHNRLDAEAAVDNTDIFFRKSFVDCYNQSIKCVTNFDKMIESGVLVEYDLGQHYVEYELKDVKVEPYDFTLGGFIDRLIVDDNTNKIYIYDYKTGVSPWSPKKVRHSDQLLQYATAADSLFKQAGFVCEVVGIVDLNRGDVVEVKIGREDKAAFLQRLQAKIARKEYLDNRINEFGDTTPFIIPVGRETDRCERCDYSLDGQCKFFQHKGGSVGD